MWTSLFNRSVQCIDFAIDCNHLTQPCRRKEKLWSPILSTNGQIPRMEWVGAKGLVSKRAPIFNMLMHIHFLSQGRKKAAIWVLRRNLVRVSWSIGFVQIQIGALHNTTMALMCSKKLLKLKTRYVHTSVRNDKQYLSRYALCFCYDSQTMMKLVRRIIIVNG